MSDEREADHTEDPRRQGTGQGYPESNPAEATPEEGTDSGAGDEAGESEAPGREESEEGEPGQATGNPDAAG